MPLTGQAWVAHAAPVMLWAGTPAGWAIALFVVLATWVAQSRLARRGHMAVDFVAALDRPGSDPADPASVPAMAIAHEPDTMSALAEPSAQAALPLADLADRARSVARAFAFAAPDSGPAALRAARGDRHSWPLQLHCRPIRFTLTLKHAALHYALRFDNRGADALGPLIIRGDLVAAAAWNVADHSSPPDADALPICHYLDGLAAGAGVELTGELRFSLDSVATVRLGPTALLLPLLRLHAESAGDAHPVLRVSACFAIGHPPVSAGGGIQPLSVDSGPRIWRKLIARQLGSGNFG